jgi:hypothetical protein
MQQSIQKISVLGVMKAASSHALAVGQESQRMEIQLCALGSNPQPALTNGTTKEALTVVAP